MHNGPIVSRLFLSQWRICCTGSAPSAVSAKHLRTTFVAGNSRRLVPNARDSARSSSGARVWASQPNPHCARLSSGVSFGKGLTQVLQMHQTPSWAWYCDTHDGLSCACTRDDSDGEVDARSPIGEAGSQRTHINAGMRKTTRSSRKATAHRPPPSRSIPKKLHMYHICFRNPGPALFVARAHARAHWHTDHAPRALKRTQLPMTHLAGKRLGPP